MIKCMRICFLLQYVITRLDSWLVGDLQLSDILLSVNGMTENLDLYCINPMAKSLNQWTLVVRRDYSMSPFDERVPSETDSTLSGREGTMFSSTSKISLCSDDFSTYDAAGKMYISESTVRCNKLDLPSVYSHDTL